MPPAVFLLVHTVFVIFTARSQVLYGIDCPYSVPNSHIGNEWCVGYALQNGKNKQVN